MAGGGGEGGSKPRPDLRSGSFKMLVFSRTMGFRHDGAINACLALLKQIASERGFEVVATEASELFTKTGLAPFEIVFFNNTSGDVLSDAQQQAYEAWMTDAGAFAGVHSATDTEYGWPFYAEVTGQYHDGHGPPEVMDDILLEASAVNHPAVAGLPNPWKRAEEWFIFRQHLAWTTKPGFRVLGRKAADSEPITWVREWGNFRSFYTGLGHDAAAFQGPEIKQHLTGGIMWAVRREHLIK